MPVSIKVLSQLYCQLWKLKPFEFFLSLNARKTQDFLKVFTRKSLNEKVMENNQSKSYYLKSKNCFKNGIISKLVLKKLSLFKLVHYLEVNIILILQ